MKKFWDKVDILTENECWEWLGSKFQNTGYGRTSYGYAHRVAFELSKGEIPEGLHILHSCDNKLCCNPNHLRFGTRQDNMDDKVSRNRQSRLFKENNPMYGVKGENHPSSKRFGENHPSSKLNNNQIVELLNERNEMKTSIYKLAKKYNVSYSCIQRILSGNSKWNKL